MKDFYQLFVEELKDMYAAEKISLKHLNDVAKAAKSPKLRETIKSHIEESRHQVKRLEEIASELQEDFAVSKCPAMEGIWKEWAHVVRPHYQDDVQDAAIISFLQRIEHYEIAVYGCLKTFAKHLNLRRIEDLLKESIKEEGLADKKLTEIAQGSLFVGGINSKAYRKSA